MINFYVTLCLVLIYINSFLDMEITFEFLKTVYMRDTNFVCLGSEQS
jgi:hypothetical protein